MSSAEPQERVDRLFAQALELAPGDRNLFLKHLHSSEQPDTVARVEQLLAADGRISEAAGEFLVPSAVSISSMFPKGQLRDSMIGRSIGSYVVRKHIGAGGFANVFLAERRDTFEQNVAIKLIHGSLREQDQIVARFELERQVLASLDHPNIARLLDGGQSEDRQPYLVMEYVDGSIITKHCSEYDLSLSERLRLFQKVCQGVAHAHGSGVIHRDLKPENILVTRDGVPKIVDFGVAKLTGDAIRQSIPVVTAGLAPITFEYASPEQIRGGAVTTQSDVYSLGCVLHTLITGRPPFDLSGCTTADAQRVVLESEPKKPSTVARQCHAKSGQSESQKNDRSSSSQVDRGVISQQWRRLKGELDTIVLKSLRKEPERRYATADHLADDVDRYVSGRPLVARPNSPAYRAGKFIRRNKVFTAAAVLIALSLIGGFISTRMALDQANHEREIAAQLSSDLQRSAYNIGLAHESTIWQSDPDRAARVLDDPLRFPLQLREFTWRLFRKACQRNVSTLAGHSDAVHSVAVSPDGRLAASGGKDRVIRVWEIRSGRALRLLQGHEGWINAVVFSPDGQTIASGGGDRLVKLWNVKQGREQLTMSAHADAITSLAFSSDAMRLVSAGYDGSVNTWDVLSGTLDATITGHDGPVLCLALSQDDKKLASGGMDQVIRLWDFESGKECMEIRGHNNQRDAVLSLSFSADGKMLASAGWNKSVLLWNVEDGRLLSTIQRPGMTGHDRAIRCVRFSPDGKSLATAGDDTSVRIWNVETGAERMVLRAHRAVVRAVSYVPGAAVMASAAHDSTVKIWNVADTVTPTTLKRYDKPAYGLAFSPDGTTLCTSAGTTIDVWDVAERKLVKSLQRHNDNVRVIKFSHDGKLIASGGDDKSVVLWDRATLSPIATLTGHERRVSTLEFSPDDRLLCSAGIEPSIRVWDLASQTNERTLVGHLDRVRALAISSDGATLLSASKDKTFRTWDLSTGQQLSVDAVDESLGDLAFAPDGSTLAFTTSRLHLNAVFDPQIVLRNVHTGTTLATLSGHTGEATSIAISPDGQTLASGAADHTIRLWDASNGQERATLTGHANRVWSVAFSPDGEILASVGLDGVVNLWDASLSSDVDDRATEPQSSDETSHSAGVIQSEWREGDFAVRHRVSLSGHLSPVDYVAISPDASKIATAGVDGIIVVWNASDGRKLFSLQSNHGNGFTTNEFSPDGTTLATTGGDRTLRLWDLKTRECVGTFDSRAVAGAIFSPTGGVLACGFRDQSAIGIIRTDGLEFAKVLVVNAVPSISQFSPDGSVLACGYDDGSIRLWSTDRWEVLQSLSCHRRTVLDMGFSDDGKTLVSASFDVDNPILVWAVPSGKILDRLPAHRDWSYSVAVSPDGRLVASAGSTLDGTVRLWDRDSKCELFRLPGVDGDVAIVRYSPDGSFFVTRGRNSTFHVWDVLNIRSTSEYR